MCTRDPCYAVEMFPKMKRWQRFIINGEEEYAQFQVSCTGGGVDDLRVTQELGITPWSALVTRSVEKRKRREYELSDHRAELRRAQRKPKGVRSSYFSQAGQYRGVCLQRKGGRLWVNTHPGNTSGKDHVVLTSCFVFMCIDSLNCIFCICTTLCSQMSQLLV